MMDIYKRLEVFGFNLKNLTKLTQLASNAREERNYKRLYRILHKIKLLRNAERAASGQRREV